MAGSNIFYVDATHTAHKLLQGMFLGTEKVHGKWNGEPIVNVDWDTGEERYVVKTQRKEEKEMSYNVNGDIVLATKTGDVFLYLGGKYYNLSSGASEMRGRPFIKSSDGPLQTMSNLKNSGDMFKEAIAESITSMSTSSIEDYSLTSAFVSAPF